MCAGPALDELAAHRQDLVAATAARLQEFLVGAPRVILDSHFRKTATEYDRKPGIKRPSCTAK